MNLKYCGCSKTGSVREHNEDAILMRADGNAGLFLVADGIGGRADGEVVSAKIRDDYDRWWREFTQSKERVNFAKALESIKSALLLLNREVVQRYGESRAGSTLAMLFLYEGNFACIWAGDSRIYRLRGLSVEQITRDDVYRAKERSKASLNGKLTGAIGLRTSLEFNTRTDAVKNSDVFFLCSDGVYRFTKQGFLSRKLLLGSNFSTPERVVGEIEREVLKNGAGDNYTMALIKAHV